MVEEVEKIDPTVRSMATCVEASRSLAEPDAAWVADRQSTISEGFERQRVISELHSKAEEDRELAGDTRRDGQYPHTDDATTTSEQVEELLSGES